MGESDRWAENVDHVQGDRVVGNRDDDLQRLKSDMKERKSAALSCVNTGIPVSKIPPR